MKLLPEKVGGENISIFFDSTFAGSAVAAPVAGETRTTSGAGFAELVRPQGNRLVEERPFRRAKFVLRHPALKAQAQKVRLSALYPLVGYAVTPSRP